MKVTVTSGSGIGLTAMAAFDDALNKAGIANYNLIKLSSIIPPKTEIRIEKYIPQNGDEFGNRLYTVLAEMRSEVPGKTLGAGVGWYQWGDDDRGVFAEHHEMINEVNGRKMEALVKNNLEQTVQNLCEFRKIPYDKSKLKIVSQVKEVTKEPSSVLVAAVYKSEGWD